MMLQFSPLDNTRRGLPIICIKNIYLKLLQFTDDDCELFKTYNKHK